MGRLAGKNAVITGAGGGIGLETSILFAKEGASILMSDISQPALEKAAAKVKQLVPNAPRVEILGAVLALTRELAMVHAREGFRFNNLCPAPLNTPLLQDWLGDDKEKRHRREVHFPMGRFGEAVEQAQAVLFLASDESSFVNGHDFAVDGGMTKCYVTAEGPAHPPPENNATKDSL
ncbi:short-chain alcohol dehydrogenase [Fusarium fujikuroi]|nr:short-chain alcohol dehydrogenase [Fusarium fujikuroi]